MENGTTAETGEDRKKQENLWLPFVIGGEEKHFFLSSLNWPQTVLTPQKVCLYFFQCLLRKTESRSPEML